MAPTVESNSKQNIGPHAILVEADEKYAWCACGLSKTQPFCDGAHRGGDFAPVIWTTTRQQWIWFCGCKQSASAPLCDGSHRGQK